MLQSFKSLLSISFLTLLVSVVQADSGMEAKTIVVGVLPDFQPQYSRTPSGKPSGFAVESFDLVAKEAGLKYRYRVLSDWDAMLTSLRIGEIDIIPNLGITAERAKDFSFSASLEQFELGLFVRESDQKVAAIEDLNGKTVAVIERNAGVKWIRKWSQYEHRIYKYPEQGLLALMSGDVDGFVYPIPIVNSLARRIKVDDKIRQVGSPVLSIRRAIAVRKDKKELLTRLNKALTTVEVLSEYQQVYQRWHEDEVAAPSKPSEQNSLSNTGQFLNVLLVLAAIVIVLRLRPTEQRFGKTLSRVLVVVVAAVLVVLVYEFNSGSRDNSKEAKRIAVVHLSKVDSSTYAGFLVKMKEQGYLAGEDIELIYMGPAGSIDKLDGMVQDYLSMNPDLILVSSTPGTLAVKRLTEGTNIPVVFAPVNDPVDAGIVESMQFPQGHITGVRLPTGDDLRLQWLSRISPEIKRVFVPYTEGDKSAVVTLKQIKSVAPQLGVQLVVQAVDSGDVIRGDNSVVPADIDAIYLPRDSTVEARIKEFVDVANERRLPLCTPSETQVRAGSLFSYGFVHYEIGRQAGQLVSQILRDAKPANLPVMTAENYLLINMKTAQHIGLEIPEKVLKQSDQLIY